MIDTKKIFLVEDDPAITEATTMLLENAGFAVQSYLSLASLVADGFGEPDLYLIDRHLPADEGISLCSTLKNDPLRSHIPVMIMSASPETERLTAEAGGDGFLAKPFSRKQLIGLVNRLMIHD